MKNKHALLSIVSFFVLINTYSQQNNIWEIGKADNNDSEFALSPSDYKKFLEYDFGWEDKFYTIGFSKEKSDFPYVLPGSTDSWGGTANLSGIRPHFLNLLFQLNGEPENEEFKFVIDVLDCSSELPPRLKITINGKPWDFQLEKGSGESVLNGDLKTTKEQKILVSIEKGLLRQGGNEIQLTSIEGSWLVFDQIRLEGPNKIELEKPKMVFLRSVTAADYEIENQGKRYQPLLVDIQHLEGTPVITALVNGKNIAEDTVTSGRYIFEMPMDAVKSSQMSSYTILANGKILKTGTIKRKSQDLMTPQGYVDTKMGTGHSRWMIAPGPWMPFGMVKLSPDNQNSGWQGGYQPTFESVGAFSHIHEWTMAGLGMLPTNGPLKTQVGDEKDPDSGYRSRIDKTTEKAPLGYYSVMLSDYGIKAELTATTRCGFQRYTYPKESDSSRVMIDLQIPAEYGYNIKDAEIQQIDAYKIEGYSHQISPEIGLEESIKNIPFTL